LNLVDIGACANPVQETSLQYNTKVHIEYNQVQQYNT